MIGLSAGNFNNMKIANVHFLQMVAILLLSLIAFAAAGLRPCYTDDDCDPPLDKCTEILFGGHPVTVCM
ncbi:hypothetical protein EB796_023416 [Bugula neritina]|uniref:Late nodulin n=1 Tax=Bugula neritina TaxID=10212 RepID=A0A7J7IXZ0_BUGNE|nr:hypothetical protein EB796_023416 [Bugula neritina]